MSPRSRIVAFGLLAVLLAGTVGGVVIGSLYRVGLAREEEHLARLVETHASLAEAVFATHLAEADGDTTEAIRWTLYHLRAAAEGLGGLGESEGFAVSRLSGDTLVVEIAVGVDADRAGERILLPSPVLEVHQRAAAGESGSLRDRDHRGVQVLAAYRPVRGAGMVVVAKVELSAARAPYVRAAHLAALVGVLVLGTVLLVGRAVGWPLVEGTEEREDARRALVQDFPGILFRAVFEGAKGWRFQLLEGAVEEITGVPAERFLAEGVTWRRLIHPDDLPAYDARWDAYAAGTRDKGSAEYRLVRDDGEVVWIRARGRLRPASPLAGISHPALSGVAVDVTRERRALEVRERAEAELHALVRNLPGAAVHILDRELRYRFSGGGALATVGLAPEALAGKHVAEVVGGDFGEELLAAFRRVLDGATATVSGEHGGRHFDVTAAPLAGPDGTVERVLVLSVDATDQRRREAELAATEARFEAFMQATPAVAWIKDGEGRLRFANRAWEELFRLTREEWQGRTTHDLLPAALADWLGERDGEVLRTGREMTVVETTGDVVGARRVWHSVRFPLIGAAGEVLVGGISLDITRQQEAEQELRRKEELLRLALESGGHGVYDVELPTGIVSVNEQYALMLGHEPEGFTETVGGWMDRLHPADRARSVARYEAFTAGEAESYRVELRLRTAEGGWKWILSHGDVVERDEAGRPTRMIGTHTDISALKEAEGALRESEERFRRAVEASPEAIFIQTHGRFAYLNPEAGVLFGVASAPALVGAPVVERFVPEDRDAVAERIRSLNEERQDVPPRVEEVLRPDGTRVQAELSAVPFRYQEADGALVFARDVSRRVRSEAQLREHLDELRRWQAVMLDREDRVQELKREVDELCRRAGAPPRYPSQGEGGWP